VQLTRRTTLSLGAALGATRAFAQPWAPERSIRFVVSYGAGGLADGFARLIARQMAPRLGQNVVVDNRPGGGGVLASETVARSAPDGLTWLLVDNGLVVYASALYSRMPYDADADLTAMGFIARFPLVLVVRAADPIADWAGFVAAARGRPPTYGSGGVASPQHLAMEVLRRAAGFEAQHVPYRNSPSAMQDLLAGNLDCMLTDSASAMPGIRGGATRPLAVLSEARVAILPDVPTTRALGMADVVAHAWLGASLPAATPAPVVARLNAALNEAIATDEVAAAMRAISAEPVPGDAAAFNAQVRAEAARWRPLIRELGIRLD